MCGPFAAVIGSSLGLSYRLLIVASRAPFKLDLILSVLYPRAQLQVNYR